MLLTSVIYITISGKGRKCPLPTLRVEPAFNQMKEFLQNCEKLVCHDKIDYKTMMSWTRRNNLENIFQSKIQLDSQDFNKRVMGQYGSRRFGIKAIVKTLASDNVKKFLLRKQR